jgi:hypothetical protein
MQVRDSGKPQQGAQRINTNLLPVAILLTALDSFTLTN